MLHRDSAPDLTKECKILLRKSVFAPTAQAEDANNAASPCQWHVRYGLNPPLGKEDSSSIAETSRSTSRRLRFDTSGLVKSRSSSRRFPN